MTSEQLATIEHQYQTAMRATEQLRLQRNETIKAALMSGWTHSQIAQATNLTRARIGQLAMTLK